MRRRWGAVIGVALFGASLLMASPAPVDGQEGPTPDAVLPPEAEYLVAKAEADVDAAARLPFELPADRAEAQLPGAAEGGGPSVTVTPSTDLVHGQEVAVRGQGWLPNDIVITVQCPAGASVVQGCAITGFQETGAQGRFTERHPVDVIIETENDVEDCRVESCLIGAAGLGPNGGVRTRLVAVTFDPAGPDPTRHTVSAAPTTDLVDGGRVDFSGEGFPIDEELGVGFAVAVVCRAAPATLDDCDLGESVGVLVEETGHVEGQIFVPAILDLPGGPFDCRTGDCELAVAAEDLINGSVELSEAALVPLEFDPDGPLRPPPTLVADPNTGLVDGDLVHLAGEGFDPERFITVQQCIADAEDTGDCEGGLVRFGFVPPDGRIDGFLGVRATFRTWLGQNVDCRVVACSIVVAHGDFGRHAEAVLEFDPDGPLLEPAIEVEPSTGLEDGDAVQVTGTGFRPDLPLFVGQCPADAFVFFECDVSNRTFLEPTIEAERFARTRAEAVEAGADFSVTYEVESVVTDFEGVRTDCLSRACVMFAADLSSATEARAPIAFAAVEPGPIPARPPFTG